MDGLTKTGYCPLRKLKEDLTTVFGLAPSHQTIKNWLGIGDIKRIENQIPNYSGYYCYDEQYIKIDGERAYRLAVFDQVLNVPVTEAIAANIEYTTIYGFLKAAFRINRFLLSQPTTDGNTTR